MKFNSYLHSFQYVLPCWVIYVLVYLSSGRWCSCLLSIFTGSTGQKNKIACILHLYLLVFLHSSQAFFFTSIVFTMNDLLFFLVANRQCITVVSRLVARKEGKHLGSACEKIATKSDEILFNTVSFHNHSYFQPVVTLFLVTC